MQSGLYGGYHLYAGAMPSLLVSSRLAPGIGDCAGKPCWVARSPRGYVYADKSRSPDGIASAVLTAGDAGAAKAQVKGKGELLGLPSLAGVGLPLRAELRGGPGRCWQATYSSALKAEPGRLVAKSD